MKEILRLSGIFPPIPTPFDEQGLLYTPGLQQNFNYWNQYDLRGYLVLGSNGEAVLLNRSEKIELFKAARSFIPDNKLMLIGTGCQSTRDTVDLTNAGASIGADAAVVLSPFYYKGLMNQDALKKHFHTVADASEIPIILYNMPACTGIDLSATTIAAIANHDNIIGIKDSGGNLIKMQQIRTSIKKPFTILAGSGSFFLPALSVGADGGIMALANIAPNLCIKLNDLYKHKKMEEAKLLQNQLTPLNTAITSQWGVPALKSALEMLNLYGGPVRPPLLDFEDQLKPGLKQLLGTVLNDKTMN